MTGITARTQDAIVNALRAGEPVRRPLAGGGRLHVDRKVPFLCVYRRPHEGDDPGTAAFVRSESSYLILGPDEEGVRADVLRVVIETLGAEFGAFLVLEVWAGVPSASVDAAVPRPGFRILSRPRRMPEAALDKLGNYLERIRLQTASATVDWVRTAAVAPPGRSPLLSEQLQRRHHCYLAGLELSPIYRHPETAELFPVVHRQVRRRVSQSLRRAFFEFSRSETSHRPPHFQSLGPTAMAKAVREADGRLGEILAAFDFLLLVSPVNLNAEWTRFQRRRFTTPPRFRYRPLPFDPADMKARLHGIQLSRLDDPAMGILLRRKRREIDRQLSMLQDRGTRGFLYGSLQLYGPVEDALMREAEAILDRHPPVRRDEGGRHLDAEQFAACAREAIDRYRSRDSRLTAAVRVDPTVAGLVVSRGDLLVGCEVRVPAGRVDALLQHEIGVHVVTRHNGRFQRLRQLQFGLPGYESLQEGLAVLTEYLAGGLSVARLRLLAARVVACRMIAGGASFHEIFDALHERWGLPGQSAFTAAARVWRGGGLTKDACYLRGLREVTDYLAGGGDLAPLFVGKVGIDYLALVEELQWRGIVREAPLRPECLSDPAAVARLARVRDGIALWQLAGTKRSGRGPAEMS